MRTHYKVGLALGAIWLVSLVYLTSSFFPAMESSQSRGIKSLELETLARELNSVRQQNEELKKHAQELRDLVLSSTNGANGGIDARFAKERAEGIIAKMGENARQPESAPGTIEHIQVIELPIVDGLHPRPDFLPLAIPEDLSARLMRLHSHPIVWWMGQIMTYIQRPQPALEEDIQKMTGLLGFESPIVGLHVRRTDKVGTEAAFHGIEEYMFHAEEYYQRLERIQEVPTRRIYLATDDASLLKEAKRKFPSYVFVSDNDISKSAGLSSRYSEDSLRGVIIDIHFLSRCDFLVCTFSSQVCRVAYEMMQYLHPNAASNFRSLDDIYYFGGQNAHEQIALYPHKPRGADEIELQPGDVIGVAGNHWDGYSKGTNHRITPRRAGLYPSYKVEDKTDIVRMPVYEAAKDFNL
ncbi:alpha-(1,6)-fucosyltransferase-like [Diadema setosum]|uniref:alpha-(1,6)-fucosyltransferase-like n=1 Tax=Diadema setosum TaxID=31175 RepID=UPI003B3B661B